MTEQASIRRATIADTEAIATLTNAAYQKYIPRLGRKPQPMTMDHQHFIEEHETWLLEAGGALAGVLVLQHEPEDMLIYSIAVSPGYQKRGYGRQLLAWAEKQARLANYGRIRLYTNALMVENIALYTRVGYQETRREPFMGGVAVYMHKLLAREVGR